MSAVEMTHRKGDDLTVLVYNPALDQHAIDQIRSAEDHGVSYSVQSKLLALCIGFLFLADVLISDPPTLGAWILTSLVFPLGIHVVGRVRVLKRLNQIAKDNWLLEDELYAVARIPDSQPHMVNRIVKLARQINSSRSQRGVSELYTFALSYQKEGVIDMGAIQRASLIFNHEQPDPAVAP